MHGSPHTLPASRLMTDAGAPKTHTHTHTKLIVYRSIGAVTTNVITVTHPSHKLYPSLCGAPIRFISFVYAAIIVHNGVRFFWHFYCLPVKYYYWLHYTKNTPPSTSCGIANTNFYYGQRWPTAVCLSPMWTFHPCPVKIGSLYMGWWGRHQI